MENEFNKSYLEWCNIMALVPNERDEVIFTTGATFNTIDNNTLNDIVITNCADELHLMFDWLQNSTTKEDIEKVLIQHFKNRGRNNE